MKEKFNSTTVLSAVVTAMGDDRELLKEELKEELREELSNEDKEES